MRGNFNVIAGYRILGYESVISSGIIWNFLSVHLSGVHLDGGQGRLDILEGDFVTLPRSPYVEGTLFSVGGTTV